MKKLFVLPFLFIIGCSATQGWFHQPTTQAVIADGCRAYAMDLDAQNALLNSVMVDPKLVGARDAINLAHQALEVALAKCVVEARAIGSGQ